MKDLGQCGGTDQPRVADEFHAGCFACAPNHAHGLHLEFTSSGIQTTCQAGFSGEYQSYEGIVHGGILATVLDATMIQCLHSAFGSNPLTSRLDIRYRESVQIETGITVTACITSRRGNHCWTHATIMQNDRVCVTARGAFKLVDSTQGPVA